MPALGTPSTAIGNGAGPQQREILAELQALRDLIDRRSVNGAQIGAGEPTASGLRELRDETDAIAYAINHTKRAIASLHAGAFGPTGAVPMMRELDAIADCAERATQRILDAAEEIEEAVNTLSASLKHGQDQALAQDIQDHIVRIFEACNFQDLSGQRISKVLATLRFVEEHIAHMMEIWGGIEAFTEYAAAARADLSPKLVNGPRLEGDDVGHASQHDIDVIFAAK